MSRLADRSGVFVCLAVLGSWGCAPEGVAVQPVGGGGVVETCLAPLARCGDACVDVRSDEHHCGGCFLGCAEGESCDHASCAPACTDVTLLCDHRCVDAHSDPRHCGGCGTSCATGEICVAGTCRELCEDGQTVCGEACVDILRDPDHCGGCSTRCSATQHCERGACIANCSGGQVACGAFCADLLRDRSHCGHCDTACDAAEKCDRGECVPDCGLTRTLCGAACSDLQNDPSHCGSCDRPCQAGQTCVRGACTGGSTGSGCSAPTSSCGGSCVNTAVDPAHCGRCDQACAAGESCEAGQCVAPSVCTSPETACDGACVDVKTALANCGACGHTCGSNQTCVEGLCGPTCPGATRCGLACVDLATDAANCGSCRDACGLDHTCEAGKCRIQCSAPLTACGDACVDLKRSQPNCGACAHACASGQLCASATCVAPAGPSEWHTVGADVAHTGENPFETGRPPLAATWSHVMGAGATQPVVYENGRAFAVRGAELFALDPATGNTLWNRALGQRALSMPTVSGGRVFAAMSGNYQNTFLYVVDAATGDLLQTFPFGSQWEDYWAPTVAGSVVYFDGGSYGGLYAYDYVRQAQVYFNAQLGQYDSWSPTLAGGRLFTFISGTFRSHDPATGVEQWKLAVPWSWTGYSMDTSPVAGDGLVFVIAPPAIYAIDPANRQTKWSQATQNYRSMPAYANHVLFAVGTSGVTAMNAQTGASLWTFGGDGKMTAPPVVANGYVYVSSPTTTWAVDANTGEAVWTTAKGGWLTVAGGQLFVAAADGSISAFSLSQ